MPINIPNIDNINEVNPVYRDGIAAIFKCTRDGWVELLTGSRPAYVQSGTEYTPSPMSDTLCEMRTDGGNQHVYYNLSDLPKVPEVPVFTAFMFSRNFTEDATSSVGFSVCNWSGVKGWSMNTEAYNNTGDTGVSKSGVADMPFSLLESANVETHLAIQFKSDNSAVGFTDEGTDTNSNTSAFKASGTNNRIVIGGAWRSAAFSGPSYANIGPYVIVWNKLLSADQITNLAANPALLKDQTLLSPMQVHNWLYLGGGNTNVSVNLGTLNITEQSATVNAETSITTNLATLNITEQTADVDLDKNVSVNLGTLNITEYAATVNAETSITTNLATLNITEQTADVNLDKNVSTNLTNLNITEQNATIDTGSGDTNVNVNLATLTIGEQSATVNAETNVNSNVVALNLTEQGATVNAETNVNVNLGTLTITEQSATVNAETNVNANVVALTFSPKTAIAQLSGALGNAQIQVYSHEKSIKVYSHEKKMVVDG